MKIKPLFDRVLIKPIEEEKGEHSILLPNIAKDKPKLGLIVEVGDGENLDNVKTEMKVKVGDKVIFNRYAGVEIANGEETLIVMRQIDIVGVIYE